MEITFVHDGERGSVLIACVPNNDPGAIGKGEESRGFPICTATIEYSGRGYRAMFGWVQLVRSTDNAFGGTAFEMDPVRFFEDSPAPFCWYGLRPTLFDAPSRDERQPLDWLAHSFLAVIPRNVVGPRQVVSLLGFSWGFEIDAERRLRLLPVSRLNTDDWVPHLPYLRAWYPSWEFPDPNNG